MKLTKIHLFTIPILKEALSLHNILKEHGEVKIVGGCIRDILLGITPHDVDLATTIIPQKTIEILKSHQIQCIPTGIEFGTIKAIINHIPFEITTLRKDISTDGRRAKVEFTNNWLEDAKRRDFTINAFYCDMDGNLTDFFNGRNDLKQKEVKFIGNPKERIQEDYLRILRYFRFISYIGGTKINQESLHAVTQLKQGLEHISGERIKTEMFKLLSNQFANLGFSLLQQAGINSYLCLPSQASLSNFIIGNPIVNLAIILKSSYQLDFDLKKLCARWKLSNAEKKELIFLINNNYPQKLSAEINLHKREYYKNPDYFKSAVLLKGVLTNDHDAATILINQISDWNFPDFPINGDDLKNLGAIDKEIGKIKQELLQNWIDSDFSIDRKSLLKLAQQSKNV